MSILGLGAPVESIQVPSILVLGYDMVSYVTALFILHTSAVNLTQTIMLKKLNNLCKNPAATDHSSRH